MGYDSISKSKLDLQYINLPSHIKTMKLESRSNFKIKSQIYDISTYHTK